ncbi:hypothetical protein FNV43_RR13326 [Rhamnella rubrinervis]|uniref:Uncharacterized protein n=1 Tax=Rhamnella rubrinervis TaxID=2594499 RepID=A0A8K0H0U8_9ROSA|nr:hypothetical protein FNV43_RR13326 [Rhamnella rubrinervis]
MKEFLYGKCKTIVTDEGNCTSVQYATSEEYNSDCFNGEHEQEIKVYDDNEVIENSLKYKCYFEEFESIKRKRNVIRSRPIRPRSYKKEKDLPFASKVVVEPPELMVKELGMASENTKLRKELKRLV